MPGTNVRNLISLEEGDLDRKIYRIFPLKRFLETLASGKNVLVNPTKWEDPFEDLLLSRTEVEDPSLGRIPLKNLSPDWYGQCWSLNKETDAMWRIYSHDPNGQGDPNRDMAGVKVRTTIRKLFAGLKSYQSPSPQLQFFVGKVAYMSEAAITRMMRGLTFFDVAIGGQGDGFARMLCIKRQAFKHEAEVRLMFQDLPESRHGLNGIFHHDIDVANSFEEVVLDPRLHDANAQVVESRLNAMGCPLPVKRSTLYRVPRFVIPMQ